MANPKNGFTLTELLVVVVLIGILAALLLSVMGVANGKARRTTCLNNLRQINLGVRMYSDDSNDKAPHTPYGRDASYTIDWTGYKNLVKSYVGMNGAPSPYDKLFACPADTFFYDLSRNGRGYVSQSLHAQPITDYSSYGFNAGFKTRFRTNSGLAGVKLASVVHPSRTVLIAEFSAFCPWSWHQPREPRQSSWVYNDAKNLVSFVDGHVSYVKVFWNPNITNSNGTQSLAMQYNPPAEYDYQWSGD